MRFLIPALIPFKAGSFPSVTLRSGKKNAQPKGLSVFIKSIAISRNRSVPFLPGINDPSHSCPHAMDGSRANHRHNHGRNASDCREL
jgi:hypothetical protein